MNTISERGADGRRRRRLHSDEFKAGLVACCMQPGMSMASVAMSHDINPNLLRRWVREAEMGPGSDPAARPLALGTQPNPQPKPKPPQKSAPPPAFVPLALPAASGSPDIRIELRRGGTSITLAWPASAAAECGAWIAEWLR